MAKNFDSCRMAGTVRQVFYDKAMVRPPIPEQLLYFGLTFGFQSSLNTVGKKVAYRIRK